MNVGGCILWIPEVSFGGKGGDITEQNRLHMPLSLQGSREGFTKQEEKTRPPRPQPQPSETCITV